MPKPIAHPNPSVAVGYVRVSTEGQGDSGLSLLEQNGLIHRYCDYQALELLTVCEDEITGKTRNRPGLEEALGYIRRQEARIFVVKKLARLGRRFKDLWAILEEIQDAGGELVILDLNIDTRTTLGRMLYAIVAHLAEGEGEEISQRTKDALAMIPRVGTHTDRNGEVKLPPGNPKNKMSPDMLRTLVRLRKRIVVVRGRPQPMPYAQIAAELNDLGFRTVNGGPWTKSTIHYALGRVEEAEQIQHAS